jgi:hypothetical protein
MRFNVFTKILHTDAGDFVKDLRCPLHKRWDELSARRNSPDRACSECDRSVLDTSRMTDAEVLATVRVDPTACLAISARQKNVTVFCKARTDDDGQ